MRNGTEGGLRDVSICWDGKEPAIIQPPAVVLRERRPEGEGSWEAYFEMALEAVNVERNPRKGRRREPGDPLLEALALGLGPGQGLELRFHSRGGRRGGGAGWTVVGRSRGTDADEALAVCEGLQATTAATLESFGKNLRFRTVAPPEPQDAETHAWCTDLLPVGVALHRPAERRAGFTAEVRRRPEGPRMVLLSPAPGEPASNPPAGIGTVLRLSTDVEVALTLDALRLGPDDLRALSAAYDWLNDGAPKCLGVPSGVGAEVDDPETLERLKKALEGWLRSGKGVRLGCRVHSQDPVAPGVLAALGRELFAGASLATRVARAGATGGRSGVLTVPGDAALDLSGCLAASFPLPRVLPAEEELLKAGVPREHGTSVGHLPTHGLLLDRVGEGAAAREVRFPEEERSRHTYLIGATGTGKSTLLLQMLAQDMEAGEGVCLIDPHGDLYQQALAAVPAHRANDVVLLDASDLDHPAVINLLECGEGTVRPVHLNFVTNEMIRIFDRLYDLRQTGGPIFEQYMRGALFLALESDYPGATLMDVPWIFEDRRYRAFLKKKCTNPLIVAFWEDQAERAGGEVALANVAPYITSKLNQFTTNALLRPIMGQPRSTIDFRKAMDRGRIVLVNLSKGLLGGLDARLLGMLVVGKLFGAALGRAAVPSRERWPFHLYIDEFQNVATETLAHVLAEARKYGLHLTLANQNLSQVQLERGANRQEAILGNVGTLLAFRLGPAAAEKLQSYTRPEVDALGLQELPNFQAAARLMADGAPLRPFVFRTLPAGRLPQRARVRHLIAASRRRHTQPGEAVEKAIPGRRRAWALHPGKSRVEGVAAAVG